MVEKNNLRWGVQQPSNGMMVVRNDGSRTVEVIGDLPRGRARLMPGDTLEIDAERTSGPARITVYDGGLQIDYGPAPRAQPSARDLRG